MTPMPHPPFHLTPNDFFVSPEEKSPQGKRFADVEDVKQKTSEALKGIKIREFKNCFEQWEKKVSIVALHQMESALKVTSD